jgi:hypothetical protein
MGETEQDKFIKLEYEKMADFLIYLNAWFGRNPAWDLYIEPPWYKDMTDLIVGYKDYKRIEEMHKMMEC